jgi:hypothetical protein
MKRRRKRAAGGGAKPRGEVGGLTSVISVRMPKEMRENLKRAAKRSGRSITQELLSRLKESFVQDRKNYRDPATRALCFLISELAENIHKGTPDWRSDPFLFRAFKLAVAQLLDALEPTGKIETPLLFKAMLDAVSSDDPMNKKPHIKKLREQVRLFMKSPEALAEHATDWTLNDYFRPHPQYKDLVPFQAELDSIPELPGIGSKLVRQWENTFYGMLDAQRDLAIKSKGTKK